MSSHVAHVSCHHTTTRVASSPVVTSLSPCLAPGRDSRDYDGVLTIPLCEPQPAYSGLVPHQHSRPLYAAGSSAVKPSTLAE